MYSNTGYSWSHVRRLTSNIVGSLQPNYQRALIYRHQDVCTDRMICTAPVERRDSKYAANTLPAKKRVVVCGGGVMGAAVAYHLGLRGWAGETVVLEKGR